jgi:hypothetical protein
MATQMSLGTKRPCFFVDLWAACGARAGVARPGACGVALAVAAALPLSGACGVALAVAAALPLSGACGVALAAALPLSGFAEATALGGTPALSAATVPPEAVGCDGASSAVAAAVVAAGGVAGLPAGASASLRALAAE